jgi:hypothetical protein
MDEADLIVAIGARFDDRITGKLSEFAPRAKFIHIDIDPAEISKNVPAHIPIVATRSASWRGWWASTGAGARRGPPRGLVGAHRALARAEPAALRRLARQRDQAAVPRPGALPGHRRATASCPATSASTRCGPRSTSTSPSRGRWINSGGLGTMGFGLPAAIGAAVACPDVPSVLLTGDGSFQMNIQELATARQFDIPVKCVIMDNGYLGMVRAWHGALLDPALLDTSTMGQWPDWSSSPRPYGAPAAAVTDKKRGGRHFYARRLDTPGPVVVDVKVSREANVVPDDRAGRAGPGNGGLIDMGEPAEPRRFLSPRSSSVRRPADGPQAHLSILVENKPGRAHPLAGCFRGRGFKHRHARVGRPTDPTHVAASPDAGRSHASDRPGDQAAPQAGQRDQDPRPRAAETVARELALFKISADGAPRRGHADGRDLPRQDHRRHARSVIVEVTGSWDKIEAFERMCARSG